eukprot:COSAG02_NODE_1420_length_12692_cov_3.543397_4_plen_37_part_00
MRRGPEILDRNIVNIQSNFIVSTMVFTEWGRHAMCR